MSELWRMEGGGTLSLREEGLRVCLEAVRLDDGRGLYKAWALGRSGRFLLGTLIPQGGGLRLSRTVSRTALEQAGCWPVTGGEAVLVYPFSQGEEGWHLEPCPEQVCQDVLVRESLRGKGRFCIRRKGEEVLLSAPFRPREPFPLPLLFCLARVEFRGGRPWLVWTFDWRGVPVVPPLDTERPV